MTGLQIAKAASAQLFAGFDDDKTTTENGRYTMHVINRMIAEAFGVENSIRESEGEERLHQIPFITDLNAEIPYHDELLRTAFVYGMAAEYWQNEQEPYQAETCRTLFREALNNCKRGVWETL